jgi:hypothetical protein
VTSRATSSQKVTTGGAGTRNARMVGNLHAESASRTIQIHEAVQALAGYA